MKFVKRNNRKAALLLVDLDGFKQVNDTFGHIAGDEVLKEVARRLLHYVRETDTVSRQGGDEFIVILSEISDTKEPSIVANKILKDISEPFQFA